MSESKSYDIQGTVIFRHHTLPHEKECRTWYHIIGDLKSGSRPLVAVHGGPGANHEYLRYGHSDIHAKTGRAVVLYDQIGNGNSTHLPEKGFDPSFWNIELFTAELDNLLQHLGIKSDFDLVGHSFGGLVGAEYAAAYPSGMKHLVLSSSPISLASWMRSIREAANQLPEDVRTALEEGDEAGAWTDEKYLGAAAVLQKRHICRLDPWPVEVQRFFETVAKDPTVYVTMMGPSMLRPLGSLKDWTMAGRCQAINVPTLVIHGEFDFADKLGVEPWVTEIDGASCVTMNDCGHFAQVERPEEYQGHILEFLSSS